MYQFAVDALVVYYHQADQSISVTVDALVV